MSSDPSNYLIYDTPPQTDFGKTKDPLTACSNLSSYEVRDECLYASRPRHLDNHQQTSNEREQMQPLGKVNQENFENEDMPPSKRPLARRVINLGKAFILNTGK